MTRGESTQSKVHYKGSSDDFLVFVEDQDQYKQWLKGDTSIPLAQIVSSFKIFLTHRCVCRPPCNSSLRLVVLTCTRQGAQGTFDAAPKNVLYSEFGTDDDDEVIKRILKEGSMQTMEVRLLAPTPQSPSHSANH
jgi:hypothetical protein